MVSDEGVVCRKPGVWTHERAAATPLVVLTAFACLAWLPGGEGMGQGEQRHGKKGRVVVAGASGGTGMWCVQCMYGFLNWWCGLETDVL